MVEHWQLKPGTLPQWCTGSSHQELSLYGGALAAQARNSSGVQFPPTASLSYSSISNFYCIVCDQKLKLLWHCFEHS